MFIRGWLPLRYHDYQETLGLGPGHTQILTHPWVGIMNPGPNASLLLSTFLKDEDDFPIQAHLEAVQAIDGFVSCRWLGQATFWGAWWPGHSWKLDRRPESSKIYTYVHLPKRLFLAANELWGDDCAFVQQLQHPRRLLRQMRQPSSPLYLQLTYPLFE